MLVVAIDIGGTFTDLLGFDSKAGTFVQAKSLTTPSHLVQGIIDCLRKSGIEAAAIDELIHGSTIAINTLIERKGAKTGLIVTRGTRDVYTIGRGNRPEAYNLLFHRHRPLVPRQLTREVDERVLASGDVHEPLRPRQRRRRLPGAEGGRRRGGRGLLPALLRQPEPRAQAGDMIRQALPDAYLSLSHDILREYREFERMSTTVVNAYIGPKVGGYVKSLKSSLGDIGFDGDLSIMRSNGGVMTPEVATERPVAMMESGPVGGIIASAQVGLALGFDNVISFDMGGTTAKASLIRDGEPTLAPGYYVGGYASGHPVMLPMIDVVEVGAGGGSIAWIDDIGALKVGPQSAGADPGPICYRGGGTEPTITDANVVLGRLDPDNFLGGQMKLDAEGAARGIEEKIAEPLKLDTVAAAQAIVDIAISKMSLAVREVSVAEGLRSARFRAGGVRRRRPAARLRDRARAAHPDRDRAAVSLALLGARHAARRRAPRFHPHLLFRSRERRLRRRWSKVHDEMRDEAPAAACATAKDAEQQIHLDLRYVGQEFTLPVPVDARAAGKRRPQGDPHRVRRALRASLRASIRRTSRWRWSTSGSRAIGKRPTLQVPAPRQRPRPTPIAHRRDVYFSDPKKPVRCPVYRARRRSAPARRIAGPALIQEHGTTTVLFERDSCRVAPSGEMVIKVGGAKWRPQTGPRKLDPVTLEVIRNALPAVANEMAADLQRTSYNMMIYEVRDYCTALLDPEGELISQNVGGVSHFVADLGVIITDGMKRYGRDGFKPGDVIITNHQAVAGQHLNNIVIYMPYFYKGELLMFAMVRAHWIDVGGIVDRLRRRRRRSPIRGSKGCSSTSSRSTRRASSTTRSIASSRTTSAFRNPRSAT